MATVLSLPLEVLTDIALRLNDPKDLFMLASSCKGLNLGLGKSSRFPWFQFIRQSRQPSLGSAERKLPKKLSDFDQNTDYYRLMRAFVAGTTSSAACQICTITRSFDPCNSKAGSRFDSAPGVSRKTRPVSIALLLGHRSESRRGRPS